MPKGLKSTSSQIEISFSLTETAANTFTTERIDLQLNALDNEVFVVTGIKMDLLSPDMNITGASQDVRAYTAAGLSKQAVTALPTLASPSCFGTAKETLIYSEGPAPTHNVAAVSFQENNNDAPSHLEYLDIIATPDFYVSVQGGSNSTVKTVAGKVYGYRARADASVYASLVQSELLSA
jgi:hypothetical protein